MTAYPVPSYTTTQAPQLTSRVITPPAAPVVPPPPIYRVITPGGTNQGFQFQAVPQPPDQIFVSQAYMGLVAATPPTHIGTALAGGTNFGFLTRQPPVTLATRIPSSIAKFRPEAFGASSFDLTFGVNSAGIPTAFGVASADYIFGVTSAGTGTARPNGVTKAVEQRDQRKPRSLESRTFLPHPPAFGVASMDLTFGVNSAGTPTAFGVSSADFVFGVNSSGSGVATVMGPLRAPKAHSYNPPRECSIVIQGFTPTIHGDATFGITFGVVSAGTATVFGSSDFALVFGIDTSIAGAGGGRNRTLMGVGQ